MLTELFVSVGCLTTAHLRNVHAFPRLRQKDPYAILDYLAFEASPQQLARHHWTFDNAPSLTWLRTLDSSSHRGRVLRYDSVLGYGHLACPALRVQTQRDVFLHADYLEGLSPLAGQELVFHFFTSDRGPVAYHVEVVAPARNGPAASRGPSLPAPSVGSSSSDWLGPSTLDPCAGVSASSSRPPSGLAALPDPSWHPSMPARTARSPLRPSPRPAMPALPASSLSGSSPVASRPGARAIRPSPSADDALDDDSLFVPRGRRGPRPSASPVGRPRVWYGSPPHETAYDD